MDSKNYLLDETFNGLDPSGVFFLKDTIRNLKKEGKSVLLSTHILPEISELCDRLIIINKGKILDNVMVDDIVNKVTVEVSFYCKNEIDNENIVNILSAFGDVELSIEESKRYGKATIKNYSGKKGSSFKVAESLNKIQLDVISLSERKEEVEEYFKRKISE
jgi:ABC-type multidrug transport system ATPase subunit